MSFNIKCDLKKKNLTLNIIKVILLDVCSFEDILTGST